MQLKARGRRAQSVDYKCHWAVREVAAP